MRKKVFLLPTIIIGFVLLFIIGSIGVIAEKGYGISVGRYLEATNGTAMFIRDNSPIQMSNRTDRDLFDNLEVGDKILVIHDGIAESYPGRTGAYWCMKLEDGTQADIPEQIMEELAELGWIIAEKGADPNAGSHEPEAYAFEAQYIRTDGYSDERSYPYHTVISSRAELEAYYEAYKDIYDLGRREVVYSDTSIGFLDACDKYDDAYFERHNLVLIVLQEGSGSIRHEITDVRAHRDENGASLGWEITIHRIVPEVGTDDMAQWHLFLEVQMGNIITDEDHVWINGKLSDNAAVYSEENLVDRVVDPQMQEPAVDEFVLVEAWLPNVRTELRYATENNFTGQIIYSFDNAWLRYGTVQKLAKAQEKLAELGYSLLIWDGFRPVEAQWKLWEAFPDPVYVANPENGFSSHSRGNTVDVTLVMSDGKIVEMPSGFDDFSLLADRDYRDVSEEAAQNALLLETIMIDCGFIPYSGEWWHFSDTDSYPVDESFIPN